MWRCLISLKPSIPLEVTVELFSNKVSWLNSFHALTLLQLFLVKTHLRMWFRSFLRMPFESPQTPCRAWSCCIKLERVQYQNNRREGEFFFRELHFRQNTIFSILVRWRRISSPLDNMIYISFMIPNAGWPALHLSLCWSARSINEVKLMVIFTCLDLFHKIPPRHSTSSHF